MPVPDDPEPVPAVPHLKAYCPHCNGKGVIIDNMLQGTTKPCPVCKLYGYNGKSELEDFTVDAYGNIVTDQDLCEQSIDSQMPLDDPSGMMDPGAAPPPFPTPADLQPSGIMRRLPTPTEAVKQWVHAGGSQELEVVKKIWAQAQEAIRRQNAIPTDFDSESHQTATEVLEKQREAEKIIQKTYNDLKSKGY